MSDSDRSDDRRNILTTIAFVVLGMMVLTGLFSLGQYQADYVNRQQEHASQRAENSGRKCYSVSGVSFCVGSDKAAEAEAQRSEDDLRAQEDMAEWAKWITAFTALQVAVGIGGTLLLWRTLMQGQESNKIALEDRRAWLGIEEVHYPQTIEVTETGTGISVYAKVHNYGQTPATNVRFGFWLYTVGGSDDLTAMRQEMRGRGPLESGHGFVFPGKDLKSTNFSIGLTRARIDEAIAARPIKQMSIRVFLLTRVTYEVTSDKQPHQTGAIHEISTPDLTHFGTGKAQLVLSGETSPVAPWAT